MLNNLALWTHNVRQNHGGINITLRIEFLLFLEKLSMVFNQKTKWPNIWPTWYMDQYDLKLNNYFWWHKKGRLMANQNMHIYGTIFNNITIFYQPHVRHQATLPYLPSSLYLTCMEECSFSNTLYITPVNTHVHVV